MRYEVVFDGHVRMHEGDGCERSPTDEELRGFLDKVMDELLELTPDAAIGASVGQARVEIEATVDANTFEAAVAQGSSLIHAAVHAAGAYTPGWSVHWCEVKASHQDDHDVTSADYDLAEA